MEHTAAKHPWANVTLGCIGLVIWASNSCIRCLRKWTEKLLINKKNKIRIFDLKMAGRARGSRKVSPSTVASNGLRGFYLKWNSCEMWVQYMWGFKRNLKTKGLEVQNKEKTGCIGQRAV